VIFGVVDVSTSLVYFAEVGAGEGFHHG
jgi:hypothetical protein